MNRRQFFKRSFQGAFAYAGLYPISTYIDPIKDAFGQDFISDEPIVPTSEQISFVE